MGRTHGNSRLTHYGTEVEKLYGNRYRIEVRCDVESKDEDWYYANIDSLFKDFGSLYELPLTIDGIDEGWEVDDGEAYPNMCLVETSFGYIPSVPDPKIVFTYETLTSSFVQEASDKVDRELNGLRRVTRPLVALDGTTYSKTIGTSTITHTGQGYGPQTLYLASSVQDEEQPNEGGGVRIFETWVQAGTLSTSKRNLSEGVVEVSTTFLVSEGSTIGPIISRSTQNVEGLKTITVTTLQDRAGNSLVDGGDNIVNSYSQYAPFTYPGVVEIVKTSLFGTGNLFDFDAYDFDLTPPVEAQVAATTEVSFRTTGTISHVNPLWNPTSWAKGYTRGIGWNYSPFSSTKAFRGYRLNPLATITSVSEIEAGNPWAIVTGTRIFQDTAYEMGLSGGPDNPEGSTYTLSYTVSPAFEDVDGSVYYKHVETYAAIPVA